MSSPAPVYDITFQQTVISYGVEVPAGPLYEVTMQLGTGPSGAKGDTGNPGPAGGVTKVNSVLPDGTGNVTWLPTWATDVLAKPTTFAPIISGTATGAVAGNDSRLTNSRTPTAHASTHSTGGSDAMDAANIGGATNTGGAKEKVAALSATTGTCTGNLTSASIFTISPTGNWTLAFSNVPATGTSCLATVIVTESATIRTMTQPAGVKAMGAALPASTASKARIYNYETVNGGTTWYVSAAVEQ